MTAPKKYNDKWFTALLLVSFLVSFIIINFIGPNSTRKNIIDGDGSGLYAYLPAILIHKTVDFTPVFEFEKNRRSSDYQGHYFHEVNDILINKFSSGSALLQLPFFLLAWLFSVIFGLPTDGYNILFQYGVALAAVFWAFIGLHYFVKLTGLYGVNRQISWLVAFAGFFGTNMFYYTFMAPAASHIYSLAAISLLLYFTKKTFLNYQRRSAYLAAFLLGIVVLIRPVNLIVIGVLPFLAGSISSFKNAIKIKVRQKDYLATVLLFIIAISPQLIINYLQTGQPIVYGYRNEGFYFNKPEFVNFLFSYRKGWFVYTPFMLLLVPAVFYLLKRSFFEMISFIGFFILLVYVFSSWWNWIYGDSFGMRPMVDFYTLFFLVIAVMIGNVNSKIPGKAILIFSALAIFLNLFQTYQYAEGIIHPDSMNKEAYRYVFLKSGKEYKGVVADTDEYFYGDLSDKPFFETAFDFEKDVAGWTIPEKLYFVPDARYACIKLDEKSVYGSSYLYIIPDNIKGKKNLYIIFDAEYLEPYPNSASEALFVVDVSDDAGKNVFYKAFKIKRLPDKTTGIWKPGHIGFKLPEIKDDMSKIKFYIWNKDKQEFYINSLGLKFYTYGNS